MIHSQTCMQLLICPIYKRLKKLNNYFKRSQPFVSVSCDYLSSSLRLFESRNNAQCRRLLVSDNLVSSLSCLPSSYVFCFLDCNKWRHHNHAKMITNLSNLIKLERTFIKISIFHYFKIRIFTLAFLINGVTRLHVTRHTPYFLIWQSSFFKRS